MLIQSRLCVCVCVRACVCSDETAINCINTKKLMPILLLEADNENNHHIK
jgi:hypothetical protein